MLLLALLLRTSAAQAESLDLQSWVDRAGVRAVVVEFYATWCKPCMEAMPRWKALKERYGRQGLRIVVINTRDEEDPGKCSTLGWSPDALICDMDGGLEQRFGVNGKLPSAFLWSWDRRLLVQAGHIGEVESAVEKLFAALPRVEISPEGDVPQEVQEELVSALNYTAKMQVVANDAERQRLRAMRAKLNSVQIAEESRCEQGRELAPNMSLGVSRLNDGSVRLRLTDLATGCILQNSKGPSARDAVENLIGQLRVPMEWPTAAQADNDDSTPEPSVSETKLGGNRKGVSFGGGGAKVVAQFVSEPPGAMVALDGKPLCPATPCSKSVTAGRHTVAMSLEQYDDVKQQVNLSAQSKVVSLKLPEAFAVLSVQAPPGLMVAIDGRPPATTPIEPMRVDPGPHEVLLKSPCLVEVGERVVLKKGERRTVKLEATDRVAGVDISARDEDENDLEAEVWIDGAKAGVTPLQREVPICARNAELRAPGMRGFQRALKLKEGEVETVTAVMRTLDGRRRAPVVVAMPVAAPPVEEKTPAAEPSFAIRTGLSGQAGSLGVVAEWRPGPVGISVGTGWMPFSVSVIAGDPRGGFYASAQYTVIGRSLFANLPVSGSAFGATAGWDTRFGDGWSLMTGVGLGGNTAALEARSPLVIDLLLGRVF